jgi:hypothetical protein
VNILCFACNRVRRQILEAWNREAMSVLILHSIIPRSNSSLVRSLPVDPPSLFPVRCQAHCFELTQYVVLAVGEKMHYYQLINDLVSSYLSMPRAQASNKFKSKLTR